MKSNRELKIKLNTVPFELLVPANNKETAIKAVLTGADAVYIGYKQYGARSLAGNSFSDLLEIINFAHLYSVKVYITLNTIFNNTEIIHVEKLIKKLYKANADGIIIQDMGILELDLPPIPLIASTQCNNDTLEKIEFLEKTGFKRVILPRELSLNEIKKIKQHTNIELECFIHGALCMSYSGQCYLSYINGKRSANRGECAQPCRKTYSLKDANGNYIVQNKHILSLKDFNLSNYLEELIFAGVTSFKIEGRLKNDTYVINTTKYYRECLDKIFLKYGLKRSSDGISSSDFIPDLYKTFNRGYTDFNITGDKKDLATVDYTSSLGEFTGIVSELKQNYFCLNSDFKLNNGDGICFFDKNKKLSGTNINKTEKNFIYPAQIKGIKKGMKIYRNFNKNFEDKLKNAQLKRYIPASLKIKETKTDYLFFLSDENGNYALQLIAKNFEIAKNKDMAVNKLKLQLEKSLNSEFKISVDKISLKEIPYIKISEINEIRRILIKKLREIRLKNIRRDYKEPKTVQYPYKEVDYRANIFNNKSELFYKKRGAKIKELAPETGNLKGEYAVMTSKYCLKKQFDLCPKTGAITKFKEPFILKDEFNQEYKVEFDCKNCKMRILKRL